MTEYHPDRVGLGCILVCWGIVFLCVPAPADEDARTKAESVFQELYGERLEAAEKTRDAEDDLKLAQEMIGAAERLDPKAHPDLVGMIYTTAARLAVRADAADGTAAKVLGLLEKNFPHRRIDALQIRSEILYRDLVAKKKRNDALEEGPDRKQRREWAEIGLNLVNTLEELAAVQNAEGRPAEAIDALGKAVELAEDIEMVPSHLKALAGQYRSRVALLKDAASLQEALERNPRNLRARMQMIRLCIVGIDDPGRAAKWMTPRVPEPWLTYVPLAGIPTGELSDQQCYQLANWYHSLARKAPETDRTALLRRAAACYQGFLKKHEKVDTQVARAKVALNSLTELLPQSSSDGKHLGKPGQQVELLDQVIPPLDVIRGKWKRTENGLAALAYTGCTYGRLMRIPVVVKGDYELTALFARIDDRREIIFTIPVGDHSVTVFPETFRNAAGIGMINDVDGCQNETSIRCTLVKKKAYRLAITVRDTGTKKVSIEVKLNGKRFLDWQGDPEALKPPPRADVKKKGIIGFGSYRSTVIFRSIKIRLLDETGSLERTRKQPR
ncbi:MAG: hypothetical protein ACLFV7_11485 [Phycisphaerae bacterium]